MRFRLRRTASALGVIALLGLAAIPALAELAISRAGDLWVLGDHRLYCGDATLPETYAALMDGEEARMVFTDPPYNVRIDGHAGGKGKAERREFVMASGEMSKVQFTAFLTESLGGMAGVCCDGAIAMVCMDWRHLLALRSIRL